MAAPKMGMMATLRGNSHCVARVNMAAPGRNARLRVTAKAVAHPPASKAPKKRYQVDDEVTHSITAERLDVVKSMDNFAETELMPILRGSAKPDGSEGCWQPQDYLPDPEAEDFLDQVKELQARSAGISDAHIVCLVGDMITEEALPTYMNMLNTLVRAS